MIVKETLHHIAKNLAVQAIEEATLEAEVMLMHVLSVDRTGLYLRLDDVLSPDGVEVLQHMVERRLGREPLAYIIGRREFFGSDFHVAPGVLIPRPETESLVEETIEFVKCHFPARDPIIADIGTGSGAIAISLALRLPRARIFATDISCRALEIAAVNRIRHNVRVELLKGDLLDPLPEPVDIIVANLPYVRDEEMRSLSPEIRLYEPSIALAGGRDGLDVVRLLLAGAPDRLRPGGVVLLEIEPDHLPALAEWVEGRFPGSTVSSTPDLSGVVRVIRVSLPERALAEMRVRR
jgi:release factor glutamine methyltransferase